MRVLIIVITALILVSGCSTNENTNEVIISDGRKVEYNGRPLSIGVIGEKPSKAFDNITFHSAEPVSLEKEEYDAYFITEHYFEELSQGHWKPVFKNINTPVFFINNNVESFIYRVDGMYYQNSPQATMHTNGFVRNGDEYQIWGYGTPSGNTDVNDTPEWIFNSIFIDIEKYTAGKFY